MGETYEAALREREGGGASLRRRTHKSFPLPPPRRRQLKTLATKKHGSGKRRRRGTTWRVGWGRRKGGQAILGGRANLLTSHLELFLRPSPFLKSSPRCSTVSRKVCLASSLGRHRLGQPFHPKRLENGISYGQKQLNCPIFWAVYILYRTVLYMVWCYS